jgi:hypothetical protein
MAVSQDAQDIARTELAEAMVPAPADLMADVGPLGRLFYLEQLAYSTLSAWAAMLSGDADEDPAATDERVVAMQGIAQACGALDAACVAVSILPPEATAEQ